MAYRAEIEIGVKGVRELEQLRSEINKSATAAESLNKVVGERGGLVQSIQNYVNNLYKAANNLNLVTAGTKAETKAIQEYVTAEEKANAILQRKINLLDQERSKREEIRRVRKLTAEGIFETTRFAEPIGPAAASQVNLSSPLRGRLNQILELERASVTASNTAFQAALKHEQTLNSLEVANDQNIFQNKLKQLDLLAKKELALIKQTDAAIEADFDRRLAARSTGRTGGGGGGRVGGTISSALIGGGFPLLFGQGPAAAAGGALGGLAGGLLGGGFGFALSIVGTAIGDAATKSDEFNKSLAKLNGEIVDTNSNIKITTSDINSLAKSLSVTTEEAVKLAQSFSAVGDAKAVKELARVFGPVGGAGTFEALAAAGRDEQKTLEAIDRLRGVIGTKVASQLVSQLKTEGSIATTASLLDAVLQKSKNINVESAKTVGFWERTGAVILSVLGGSASIGKQTVQTGQRQRVGAVKDADKQVLDTAIGNLRKFYQQRDALEKTYSTKSKVDKTAEKAARDAEREAKRVSEVIRSRIAEAEIIKVKSNIQDKIAAAEASGDTILAIRLQGQQREVELQYRYAQELAKETNLRAQQAIIYEGQVSLVANLRDTERQLNEAYNQRAKDQISAMEQLLGKQYELTERQKQQKEVADGIANTIGQGMTSAFDAVIQGSQDFNTSLRQIASGVLIDIANQLLQIFVIQKAISAIGSLFGGGGGGGLFSYAGVQGSALGTSMISGGFTSVPFTTAGLGFGGFMASGGSVTGKTPYIVGERGPELFVPNSSGTIVPNSQLGGMGGDVSVVVNVDAKGTDVQGDPGQARQLGAVISAAIQAELLKQQRPGGILYSR